MSDTPEYDGDEFNNILRNIIQEPDEILHDNQMGVIRWGEEFGDIVSINILIIKIPIL